MELSIVSADSSATGFAGRQALRVRKKARLCEPKNLQKEGHHEAPFLTTRSMSVARAVAS